MRERRQAGTASRRSRFDEAWCPSVRQIADGSVAPRALSIRRLRAARSARGAARRANAAGSSPRRSRAGDGSIRRTPARRPPQSACRRHQRCSGAAPFQPPWPRSDGFPLPAGADRARVHANGKPYRGVDAPRRTTLRRFTAAPICAVGSPFSPASLRTFVRWWDLIAPTPLNSHLETSLSISLFERKIIVVSTTLSHCSKTGKPLTGRQSHAYSSREVVKSGSKWGFRLGRMADEPRGEQAAHPHGPTTRRAAKVAEVADDTAGCAGRLGVVGRARARYFAA